MQTMKDNDEFNIIMSGVILIIEYGAKALKE